MSRTITFTQFEWSGNKLLKESEITTPYLDDEPVNLRSDFPDCDHITLRRTIAGPCHTRSAIIESLYK